MLNNSGVNKVILVGYVARQPRRHNINDTQMLCFPLVTQEYIKKNGVNVEHLEQHQIKVPLNCSGVDYFVNKGNMVYLQGKIQTQQFTDEQGIKRYKTEIVANFVQRMVAEVPDLQTMPMAV